MADGRAGIAKAMQEGSGERVRVFRETRDPADQKAVFEKVTADHAGTRVEEWAGEQLVKFNVMK